MGSGKENKSLLYWVYQQCKNHLNQENKKSDNSELEIEKSEQSEMIPPDEIKKDEIKKEDPSPDPTSHGRSGYSWPLSEDRLYLKPLLEMTAILLKKTEVRAAGTVEAGAAETLGAAENIGASETLGSEEIKSALDMNEADIRALESRLFAIVKKNPYYPDFCKEAEAFAKELSEAAADYMEKLAAGSQENIQEQELKLRCSEDGMYALAFLSLPLGEGKPADEEALTEILKEAGVVYGVDAETLKTLASGDHPMQMVLIARGSTPIDGVDGQVIEKYQRVEEITISQDERGTADFKNINSVQSVQENQVICELVLPTAGEPGTDVYGHLISQREGVLPPVPAGKNTRYSEDGTRLIASSSGHLLFRNGCFEVTEVLVIRGDVDYSVGNLDFPGDIIVQGEVKAGFTVKAAGTITVHGTVEGAALISGNDVILKKGMNGSYEGEIHAKGDVRANFLENCKVYADGSVTSNSIISCKTYAGDSVTAEGSIATIIGGSVTALYTVTARIIGNKNLKATSITLGTAPWLIEERKTLMEEQKAAASTLDMLNKNLDYLHRNKSSIPAEKLEVLAQLEEQQQMYHEKKAQLENRLEELDSYQMNFSKCRVKGNMIFPGTRVTIGPYVHIFDSVALRCNVHVSGEEIVLGTM